MVTGLHVAVVGATGNVGTALLRALAAAPGIESVVGVARRLPDSSVRPYDGASWVSVDIADPRSGDRLQEAFAGADAVVHLAWLLQPSHDESALRRTNVAGTKQVAHAARAAGKSKVSSLDALAELVAGFTDRAGGSSPVLRDRAHGRSV